MSDEKQVSKYEYETDHGAVKLTPDTVRKYLVSGDGNVSEQEIMMFLTLCKYQRLNPFLREVYLIKYSNSKPATVVVGKDVHVKRAAKHAQFDGLESGVITEKDGKITEREGSFKPEGETIVGGWAIGHRKDWGTPRKITVSFSEYVGKKQDGTINSTWTKMPGTMMVKVAEAQCLRAMFPEELQALYNAEEMGGDYSELSQKPIPQGNDKTVESVRADIHKLIEDNGDILDIEYAEAISGEMYATKELVDLVNILDSVRAEIKSIRGKETRDLTKEGFKKASELYAEKRAILRDDYEEPALPDSEPDEKDIF